MRDRRTTLLWMKDLLDHMNRTHGQLEWAADGPTSSFLTDALLVDLTECRRLCEHLRDDARLSPAAPRLPLAASA